MKKTMTIVALAAMTLGIQAKTVKKTMQVKGLCEMCEKRIETAVKKVPGVVTANWSVKTKKLAVVFDDKKTSEKAVRQTLLNAGHDVDTQKADNKAYNTLPACCKYRSANAASMHHGK